MRIISGALAAGVFTLALSTAVDARITRIDVDETLAMPAGSAAAAITY